MVQRCRETTVVLGLTATIHTKGTASASVTILHQGTNKQCHKGARANACVHGHIIDRPLMRIRLHNLRHLLGCMGFVRALSPRQKG